MLHTRDMLPPVRELIEEQVTEVVETPTEDVYERDAATGVLVRVGKTPGGKRTVTRLTGNLVESFETTGADGKPVLHEGSMKQVDLHCGDCGSLLRPANDRDFYYLLCSRLDERAHDVTTWVIHDDTGAPVLRRRTLESEKPYADCVLECGNERLGSPD